MDGTRVYGFPPTSRSRIATGFKGLVITSLVVMDGARAREVSSGRFTNRGSIIRKIFIGARACSI